MIQGFPTILQQDLIHCYDYYQRKIVHNEEQNKRIALVATRLIATLGMAFGALAVISKIPFLLTHPVGAALTIAFGITTYAVSHDMFVIAKNATENMNSLSKSIQSVVKAFWEDVKAWRKGEKNQNDVPTQPITQGTFFRIIWDKMIDELLEVRK